MVNQKRSFWSKLFRLGGEAGADPTQDEQTRTIIVHRDAIGSSGTRSYSGYAREDYLHTLYGRRRADVFDEMRRSDSQTVMILSAVKNVIKSATWEMQAFDDSPEAEADKELIEHILMKDMDDTFAQFLSEALTMIDFGHSVFEVTHKVVKNNPKFGSYTGLASLGFRSQRTIERWNLDKQTGKLQSVTQLAYGDLERYTDIPADFLLVFSINKEGSNYEGISMLRSCYGPWIRKNMYLKLNAIGIEKFAVPTPLVEVPSGKQDSPEYDFLTRALESYTSHEANYLTFPEGWKITLNNSPYDPEKVEVSIGNEDKRMTKAFLANFMELGQHSSGSGSRAVSADQSSFFLLGLEHIAKIICEGINQKLIPALVQINRGPREGYPTLNALDISDRANKELADIITELSGGNWLTPSDTDEDHLRKRYRLPKQSFTGLRKPQAPMIPGMPGQDPQGPSSKGDPSNSEIDPQLEKGNDPNEDEDEGDFGMSLSERILRDQRKIFAEQS